MGSDGQASLPLEILPHILEHLQWRTVDLYACCLVSRRWNGYATPRLYARLFLRDQKRLIKVFDTLRQHDYLASLVRILEIRVFPFGLVAEELEQVEANLLASLLKATNLEELYWTRTGSLTDRVIPFLPALSSLQTLELTGSSRFYTPASITKHLLAPDRTPNLKHFSALLPDRNVCEELPRWAEQLGPKLKSFSILCQHSAVVTDSMLKEVSTHLTGLTRLSIAGAKAVTAEGICSLVKSGMIEELSIEGLAVHPSSFATLSHLLPSLHTLSLTYPRQSLCSPHDFWTGVSLFVENLPHLTAFTLYRSSWNTSRIGEEDMMVEGEEAVREDDHADDSHDSGSVRQQQHPTPQEYRRKEMEDHASSGRPILREPRLSTSFVRRLLLTRGPQLKKLRIHGILTALDQLKMICEACVDLQDLVVQLFEEDKLSLETSIASLPHLISLHILSPLYSALFLSEKELSRIAKQSSTTLRQLGFRNRVWLVDRCLPTTTDEVSIGEDTLDDGRSVVLKRWDMSAGTFPEVLLVVRA